MKRHVYADPLRLSWTKMSPPFSLLNRLSILSKNTSYLRSPSAVSQARCFSTTQTVFVRKNKDRPAPTKAKLAARERKKALKARKNAYEHEKMPLSEAISVLRVCIAGIACFSLPTLRAFLGCGSLSAEFNVRAGYQDSYEA